MISVVHLILTNCTSTICTHTHTKCCLGGEVPKSEVLSSIYRELEDCKKSLSSYLLSKRQVQ